MACQVRQTDGQLASRYEDVGRALHLQLTAKSQSCEKHPETVRCNSAPLSAHTTSVLSQGQIRSLHEHLHKAIMGKDQADIL